MNTIELSAWEEFEVKVEEIFKATEKIGEENSGHVSKPLFRGHSKASWMLKTTLERYTKKQYSVEDYYRVLTKVEPAVTIFTSKQFKLEQKFNPDCKLKSPQGYKFMVYLRHHGFPSPLLDWTRSPYVAAYFAFNGDEHEENVSIFCYREYGGKGKVGRADQERVTGLGPYVAAHKRHFIQQCEYTICTKEVGKKYVYGSHEEALNNINEHQDIIEKFLIPANEKEKVLEKLDRMNINSYSLFGDEDSLMSMLAYREIKR